MQLEATDLLAINRGGVNYKVTGAELKDRSTLQPTDTIMVQRGSTLYKVSFETLTSAIGVLDPTDFILVQRGEEMFSLHPNLLPSLVPSLTMNLDSTGLGTSDRAISIAWSGARSPGGFVPQIQFPDSPNRDTYYFSAQGSTWFVPSQLGSGASRAVIYGAFDKIDFQNSLALVSAEQSSNGAFAAMIPNPDREFGLRLYSECPRLTSVPLDIPWQSLGSTFKGCTVFNQDVAAINSTGVINFRGTFESCTAFNRDVSSWDVSSATDMGRIFFDCSSYNKTLNAWGPQLGKVITFQSAFNGCSVFNQPLNQWDVSGVRTLSPNAPGMDDMFKGTTNFNRDLSGWCVTNIPNEPFSFAQNSGLDPANYPVWGTCP